MLAAIDLCPVCLRRMPLHTGGALTHGRHLCQSCADALDAMRGDLAGLDILDPGLTLTYRARVFDAWARWRARRKGTLS